MEQTKTIFISTIVVLVATLSLVLYILSVTKKKYIYPPHVNHCPDYYQKNSFGDCYDKHNVFHTIDNVCYSENFAKYNISGTGLESGLCKKKQWANQCKVSWDGITNNSELCI
jgi:hypothetical protein